MWRHHQLSCPAIFRTLRALKRLVGPHVERAERSGVRPARGAVAVGKVEQPEDEGAVLVVGQPCLHLVVLAFGRIMTRHRTCGDGVGVNGAQCGREQDIGFRGVQFLEVCARVCRCANHRPEGGIHLLLQLAQALAPRMPAVAQVEAVQVWSTGGARVAGERKPRHHLT